MTVPFDLPTLTPFWKELMVIIFLFFILRSLSPPANLRHLPRVPMIALLRSYLSGEVEDQRIKRLIVPFANERGEGLVLVYALGRWMVHVIDRKLIKDVSEDIISWPKQTPPDDMLLWNFIGRKNIVLSNGADWKRVARPVKAALDRNVPVHAFVDLTKKLFEVIGNGGHVMWDDLASRFTLDAVGTTALGVEFNSIENPHGAFVSQYHAVMHGIAYPLYYVAFPQLERWIPRKKTIANIESLVGKLMEILERKKQNKGNDMLTYMLEEPDITDSEYRNNMVLFFIAGHDTTAGAISSIVYYLAKFPDLQARARREVLTALNGLDPNLENLRHMPYMHACIRESMRTNTSNAYVFPRVSEKDITLHDSKGRAYFLPASTSVVMNLTALHYNESIWPNANSFDPTRFLSPEGKEASVEPNIWVPFLQGPRQCPARNFAMYEIRTITAMLLAEYEFTLPRGSIHTEAPQNGFSPFGLTQPKNLGIIFNKRS